MADGIVTLTSSTFDETVNASDKPVVVDFWAEWCGPCKMIAPVLDEIATEQAGKLKVAKLNVDDNPATASRYQVRSIPTLIFFKDGQPVDKIVGAHPKANIVALSRRRAPPKACWTF